MRCEMGVVGACCRVGYIEALPKVRVAGRGHL